VTTLLKLRRVCKVGVKSIGKGEVVVDLWLSSFWFTRGRRLTHSDDVLHSAGAMADGSPTNLAIAASPTPDCFSPGGQGLLGLRLGGLFGILVFSTVGIFVPFFAYKAKLNSLFFLLRGFAAGVVLTTG